MALSPHIRHDLPSSAADGEPKSAVTGLRLVGVYAAPGTNEAPCIEKSKAVLDKREKRPKNMNFEIEWDNLKKFYIFKENTSVEANVKNF